MHERHGGLEIALFGASLVSSYWNHAAGYFRGIIQALHQRGHRVTFYEPDAFDRQRRRDMDPPPWCRVVVYPGTGEEGVAQALEQASAADVVVKASGVGVADEWLEREVPALQGPRTLVAFWDLDPAATLERLAADPADPFHEQLPRYDLVLTCGGGAAQAQAYRGLGARECLAVHPALDPAIHHPVASDPRFIASLGYLGNRLPGRSDRAEQLFFGAAARLPGESMLLGGSGWQAAAAGAGNVRWRGPVPLRDRNAFHGGARMALVPAQDPLQGSRPPSQLFEVAGVGACVVTDACDGIAQFLEPGREVLLAASADDVAAHLAAVDGAAARRIGTAARARLLAGHTYAQRARQLEAALAGGRRHLVAVSVLPRRLDGAAMAARPAA